MLFRSGSNWALCDGSVRFIPESVDMNMLANMATMSGGEVVNIN